LVSLLTRDHPKTSDLTVTTPTESFQLHKYILSARSPYFSSKLASAPDTSSWKLPPTIPPQSFGIALKHLYLGEIPRDLGGGPGTGFTDSEVLAGVDRISKHLEIQNLPQLILDSNDRRLARQRRQDEVEKGRDQLQSWFRDNILRHAIEADVTKADDIKWDHDNGIFADILLRADEDEEEDDEEDPQANNESSRNKSSTSHQSATAALGIPFETPSSRNASRSASRSRRRPRKSKIYPVHKAQLLRSEYFTTMFESSFREAQTTPHLQIINIDCSPQVLEIILTFLYTEKADFGLDLAVDVLFAADMLFLEKVKAKAAVVISTLANGNATGMSGGSGGGIAIDGFGPESIAATEDLIDIYLILRAAWLTRVQRLEEFAARYIAYRLEAYIDDPEFAELVKESAGRINARQETDSIELLDDIRYYLSERFRLRFEDAGLEEVMDEEAAMREALAATTDSSSSAAAAATAPQQSDQVAAAAAATGIAPQDTQPSKLPNWSANGVPPDDEGVDMTGPGATSFANGNALLQSGAVRTLDGELAGDEFAADAVNYQILLGKIDALLERLKLDA
jgi:ankyrin repeat/BTB/POZ domain-containing protein 1